MNQPYCSNPTKDCLKFLLSFIFLIAFSYQSIIAADYITVDCPNDINVAPDHYAYGAVVHWTPPTATTTCVKCTPDDLVQYMYMGQYGSSNYYCSLWNTTWGDAKQSCEEAGGHLAIIDDSAENAYLASFLSQQIAFIGLSDVDEEGEFRWVNSAPLTYSNWDQGQPNNYLNSQHYVEMSPYGYWNDTYVNTKREFILEMPCIKIEQVEGLASGSEFPVGTTKITYKITDECGNVEYCSFNINVSETNKPNCPDDILVKCNSSLGNVVEWREPKITSSCTDCASADDIANFVYMGYFNGKNYYCSSYAATWEEANAYSAQNGGSLAKISDASTNDFLTSRLRANAAFIGLSDKVNEGDFRWRDGTSPSYSNWYPGQPNDYNANQDYVELLADGTWNDAYYFDKREFIMEIACANVEQISGLPSGSEFPFGATLIKYKITDGCGGVEYCEFTVTIDGGISLTCPDDIYADCDKSLGGAKVTWAEPSATSCCTDCGEGEYINNFVYMGHQGGSHYYCSTYAETWNKAQTYCKSKGGNLAIVNDAYENSFLTSRLQTNQLAYIGLSDQEEEGVFRWVDGSFMTYENFHSSQPDNHLGNQDYVQLVYTGVWDDAFPYDKREFIMEKSCLNIEQVEGPSNGSLFPPGETWIKYKITDACGKTATCGFKVVVGDCCNNKPSITCPDDFVGCPDDSIDPSKTGKPTTSDNNDGCDAINTEYDDVVVKNDPCGEGKIIKRTWKAGYGSTTSDSETCVQYITLQDNEAPIITWCPSNISLTGNSECKAKATWNAPEYEDDCSGIRVTSTHNSGDWFVEGTTTVTYSVKDDCGNKSTCSFTVTVGNCCSSPPSITCPDNVTICPGDSTDPSDTGSAIMTQGGRSCGTAILDYHDEVVSQGDCNGAKVIHRKWKAYYADYTSMSKSCTQIITIKDDEAPTLTWCPNDITVTATGSQTATATWNAPEFDDNCAIKSITNSHDSGDAFSEGTTQVKITAEDKCGNRTSCKFNVTVRVTCDTPPTITCPNNFVGCPGESTNPSNTGTATTSGSSECGDIEVEYVDTVESEESCGSKVIKRKWSARYKNYTHLKATCIQTITLEDDEAPTLTWCPNDITVTATGSQSATATWNAPEFDDNCAIKSITNSHDSGDTFSEGTTQVKITAEDKCGNRTSCKFNVTVRVTCDTPPTITCPNNFVGCPGESTNPSNTGTATTSGSFECGDIEVEYVDTVESEESCGSKVIKRKWSARYKNYTHLKATCTQTITLEDDEAPTLTWCPNDITVTATGSQSATATWNAPEFDDNCAIKSITNSHDSGDEFTEGITQVKITAEDECGNKTSCRFNVTVNVECNSTPSISCPSDYKGCPNESTDPSNTGNITSSGNTSACGDLDIDYHDTVESQGSCGSKVIKRKWTVSYKDHPELKVSCTQTITLEDDQRPTLRNCPQDVTLEANSGCERKVTWTTPTTTDNCSDPTLTSNYHSGDTFYPGTTTVTYTAKDDCGNSQTCSFDITITSRISLECPDDITVQCQTGHSSAYIAWKLPKAQTCCSNCSEGSTIPGFIYMGSYNGHHYYCSASGKRWTDAKITAESFGGHLAVINDEDENDFVASVLQAQRGHIGLSDELIEGDYEWVNGDEFTFSNWASGQPNGGTGENVVEIGQDGKWYDIAKSSVREYVMELPCVNIEQTDGPANGELFPRGTTRVEYTATDECGYSTSCQFNVTVECYSLQNYCDVAALNTDLIWIDEISLSNLNYYSGNDRGYGDYTNEVISLEQNKGYLAEFLPGYGLINYSVFWNAWIDYNQDGDFSDSGEEVLRGANVDLFSQRFIVPDDAELGYTTMRITMGLGQYPEDPCANPNFGEIEDYAVLIEVNDSGGQEGPDILPGTDIGIRHEEELPELDFGFNIRSNSDSQNSAAKKEFEVKISPNPVSGRATIRANQTISDDATIQLRDILGKSLGVMQHEKGSDRELTLNLQDLGSGIYYIILNAQGQSSVSKVIVQH